MTKSAVRKPKTEIAPKGSDNGKPQTESESEEVSRVKTPPAPPPSLQPILFTVDEAKVVLQALAQQWKNGQVTYPALGQINVMAAAKIQASGGGLDQDSGE